MKSGIHLSTPAQLQGISCLCLPTRLVARAALRAASHQQRQRSSLISSSLRKGLKQHAPQRSTRLQCSAQQATGEGPPPSLLMMHFSSGSSISGVYLAVNFRKGFPDASLCIGTLHLLELLASFHKIPP